jgi:hypothetical protein
VHGGTAREPLFCNISMLPEGSTCTAQAWSLLQLLEEPKHLYLLRLPNMCVFSLRCRPATACAARGRELECC